MRENTTKNKQKKKIPLILKIILLLLITIIITVGGISIYGYKSFNKIVSQLKKVELKNDDLGIVDENELQQYKGYSKLINIALFGIDSTDTSSGRSDSIMVATLDPIHNKLKLTSFMRDSYVSINGYGYDKLNHAYAYGGPALSINTLNTNFGLNIADFIAVDFSSLPKIIDTFGGITLEITNEELKYINDYIESINSISGTNSSNIYSAGIQHLNGVQALAYSRIRYTSGGDFERTQRQRNILTALFNEALNIPPSEYLNFISDLTQYVTTSLDNSTMLKIATKISTMGLNGISIEQERFPIDNYSEGKMINGVYYLTFDASITKRQVMNYIFDDELPN